MPEITAPSQQVIADGNLLYGAQVARYHPDVSNGDVTTGGAAYVPVISISGKRGVVKRLDLLNTSNVNTGITIYGRVTIDGGEPRYMKLTVNSTAIHTRSLHGPIPSSANSEANAWDNAVGSIGATAYTNDSPKHLIYFEESFLFEVRATGSGTEASRGVVVVQHD